VGAPAALAANVRRHSDDPELRAQLAARLEDYTGSRAAAADLVTALLAIGVGAGAGRQFTPGALSLGPVLPAARAQHAAVGSTPVGIGALGAAASGSALAVLGVLAAFGGVIADPVQRRLGLHQRRLDRLIDALDADLRGDRDGWRPRDHYVARVVDLLDVAR